MLLWIIDAVLLVIVVIFVLYPYVRPRMVAKLLDNETFAQKVSENAQLIDVRESTLFRKSHIMGARNLPESQIDQSLSSFSKDKEILLYENGRPQITTKVAGKLKKAGYENIFILKSGLNQWNGKIKKS